MDKQRTIPTRPTLGKGLASLLPGNHSATAPASAAAVVGHESNKDRHPGISMCGIDEIAPNEFQPRRIFNDATLEELAASIKANGLIQPLVVRKTPKGHQLIAGERRWRAAKLAGLKHVPIVIRRSTDKEALELALIENIQREELNCVDAAQAYHRLINEFALTQDALSARLGKDRVTIANHMRLLKLPASVQALLKSEKITFGHGRALAALEDSARMEKLAQRAVDEKWSVRDLEGRIQQLKGSKSTVVAGGLAVSAMQLRIQSLERDLAKKLATKVRLNGDGKRGKIVIEYFNPEDLDRLLGHILK
ncbi:MAG: ParB/RepB/Spo0J family partition protein [Deltaproteobacteria bacterium]|nr:ParB/RepB/Spo0J family partition protein [Deltaproteobacteria bacterium]